MLSRDIRARPHAAVLERSMFEGPHHAGTNRHNSSALCSCPPNRPRSCSRYVVRLVERKQMIQRLVAGRGNPGSMRDGSELCTACADGGDQMPVESKPGGWRFKSDRWPGDFCPYIPKREWLINMCVLDRPSVTREAGPN